MPIRKKMVDYDAVAAGYNRRYQQDPHQGVQKALRRILSELSPSWVLEIGCGTCHWLAQLSAAGELGLVGIDRSHKMLAQADPAYPLKLCQGTAESVPLRSEAFDSIYCVNAIHHFANPKDFIFQANRLLRPGGTLAIIGMNPRDPRNQWYLYDFFEGTLAADLGRFPDWSQVKGWLHDHGFANLHLEDVECIHAPKSRETVLLDPFLRKNGCSQLALLSQREYMLGLEKLKAHVRKTAKPGYQYENHIVLSMLLAHKPST